MRYHRILALGICGTLAGTFGCGGSASPPVSPPSGVEAEEQQVRTFLPEGSRCGRVVPPDVSRAGSAYPTCTPGVESEEADLNGDGHPDLRRLYLIRCPAMQGQQVTREILCREADVNFDGRKDVFRYFRGGGVASEELDWNFDGVIDAVVYFAERRAAEHELAGIGEAEQQAGRAEGGARRPALVELDQDGDGEFEMQIPLTEVGPRHVRVDAVGDHHPDIFETYEKDPESGQWELTSIHYDLFGDGEVRRVVRVPRPQEESDAAATPATPAPGEE